jgi:hypothetical protein
MRKMREGGRELRSPEATIRLDSKAGLCGKGDSCSIVVPSRFSFYKFCWHVNYWLVVLIVVLNSHWCWTFATLLPSSVFPSLWLSSLLQVSQNTFTTSLNSCIIPKNFVIDKIWILYVCDQQSNETVTESASSWRFFVGSTSQVLWDQQ